jgi:hypothetical protein
LSTREDGLTGPVAAARLMAGRINMSNASQVINRRMKRFIAASLYVNRWLAISRGSVHRIALSYSVGKLSIKRR